MTEKDKQGEKAFVTSSGIPVQPLYDRDSLTEIDLDADIGRPGEYPFTRGIYPDMYRGRRWTMRQYAGFGTTEETNERYRFLLDRGQTGLSVAFDLPTQMGYDSDHPRVVGEVGRVGVAIDSLRDMETLFEEIPLDRVSTSMTINATAPIILSMYLCLAEDRGVSPNQVRGTVQNDLLKEYVARGTYIYPPDPSIRLTVDLIDYVNRNYPRWNPISISGYHMREAGATAVQEIAFTLSNALAYLNSVIERGIDVDRFAPRLSFFFACHNHFFEEVAKFRAARRTWARLVRERYGAKDDSSCRLRFHTQTSGVTLTAQEPGNNVVRVAYQALAAVLGGTQSLHTNSMDEALYLPTEESVLIALRTQQIVAAETGAADTPDPLAGSFFVENLTREVENEVVKIIDKIDAMGGAIEAVKSGYMENEIRRSAYRYQKMVEEGTVEVVGVTSGVANGESKNSVFSGSGEVMDSTGEEKARSAQVEKLRVLREKRDGQKVESTLEKLREVAAAENENLMPHIQEAVRAFCTVGEISDALREVFGEYRKPAPRFNS
jgi:methylmalonyl-CoA mutase N-terminal domain/subunit